MKNHISVLVTKKDFETTDYTHPTDCALATALKRSGYKLGSAGRGGIGGSEAGVNGEEYVILEWEEVIMTYQEPSDLIVNLLRI